MPVDRVWPHAVCGRTGAGVGARVREAGRDGRAVRRAAAKPWPHHRAERSARGCTPARVTREYAHTRAEAHARTAVASWAAARDIAPKGAPKPVRNRRPAYVRDRERPLDAAQARHERDYTAAVAPKLPRR